MQPPRPAPARRPPCVRYTCGCRPHRRPLRHARIAGVRYRCRAGRLQEGQAASCTQRCSAGAPVPAMIASYRAGTRSPCALKLSPCSYWRWKAGRKARRACRAGIGSSRGWWRQAAAGEQRRLPSASTATTQARAGPTWCSSTCRRACTSRVCCAPYDASSSCSAAQCCTREGQGGKGRPGTLGQTRGSSIHSRQYSNKICRACRTSPAHLCLPQVTLHQLPGNLLPQRRQV